MDSHFQFIDTDQTTERFSGIYLFVSYVENICK